MSSLTVFNFESNEVRFVDGKPVANDVAKVLGYAQPHSTISKLVSSKNKGCADLATPGGIQSVTVLEEAGIYQLIFSSKLESAERFQDWVFSEVLPSIRKTGSYTVSQQPKLSPNKEALEISRDVREITDNLLDNPRLAQFLIDHAISGILPSQGILRGLRLKGVVEIAEEMGFPVNFNNRSQLGKFVKAACLNLAQYEQRLVNGTMRSVACYPSENEDVKQAIADFFNK